MIQRDVHCILKKELEQELSHILNYSIKNCATIGSKLRILQVFEGIHERDVIQVIAAIRFVYFNSYFNSNI